MDITEKVKMVLTKVPTAAALAVTGTPMDSKGKNSKRNIKFLFCDGKHRVTECPLPFDDKMKIAREQHRCVKSLAKGHSGKDCLVIECAESTRDLITQCSKNQTSQRKRPLNRKARVRCSKPPTTRTQLKQQSCLQQRLCRP